MQDTRRRFTLQLPHRRRPTPRLAGFAPETTITRFVGAQNPAEPPTRPSFHFHALLQLQRDSSIQSMSPLTKQSRKPNRSSSLCLHARGFHRYLDTDSDFEPHHTLDMRNDNPNFLPLNFVTDVGRLHRQPKKPTAMTQNTNVNGTPPINTQKNW